MKKNNKHGFILILTMMVVALATAIITQMFYQGSAFVPLSEMAVKKEKAKMLALGGVQLAVSKLSDQLDFNQNDDRKKSQEVQFLERILPSINRWDKVTLQQESDAVAGEIKICISCEDGKINLNNWYDFKGHKFRGSANSNKISYGRIARGRDLLKPGKNDEYKQVLKKVFSKISQITRDEADPKLMMKSLQNFLSERSYPLLDITQLLELKGWEYFKDHIFYRPPLNQGEDRRPLYLTDLFTIWTDEINVQPWLLSDSLQAVLGFPRANGDDIIKRQQAVQGWIKNFKPTVQWTSDWNKTLGLVYGTDSKNISKQMINLFDPSFNPKVFSVVSHGTTGGVTQKVYAIIKKQSKGEKKSFFRVEKLYWI